MSVILGAIDWNLAESCRPPVIATYTVDANENLSTTSTFHNMPVSEAGGGWMRSSPSGKFLVAGGSGIEIFHFNGGSPLTKYKMLFPGDGIGQIFWDTVELLGTRP
jgi:hypothetical protein